MNPEAVADAVEDVGFGLYQCLGSIEIAQSRSICDQM